MGVAALSLSLLTAMSIAPAMNASAAAKKAQKALHVSVSATSTTAGSTVTLSASGGSGSGHVTYTATGTGCTVTGTSLANATGGSCSVIATKAAAGMYKAASSASASVTFTFASANLAHPVVAQLNPTALQYLWPIYKLAPSTGPINDTANGDNWFINSYYAPGDHWYETSTTAGSTVNLYWTVTDQNGNALANTPVTLDTNFANGGANQTATWSVPAGSGETMNTAGQITLNTSNNGNVNFTLVNTNVGDGATAAPTTPAAAEALENNGSTPWTRMALVVGSDKITANPNSTVNQQTDLVDVLVLPNTDAASHATPDSATIVSTTGVVSGTSPIDNTVNGDGWFINAYYSPTDKWQYNYITAGSTVSETWKVLGSNGQPLMNKAVTLEINFAGNGATWSHVVNGVEQVTGAQDSMSGVTDNAGLVTFTFTNTDTATGSQPADKTSADTANGLEYFNTDLWARTALIVGNDIITANPNATVNQATTLNDLIILPAVTSGNGGGSTTPSGPTTSTPDVASLVSVSGAANNNGIANDTPDGLNWFLGQYFSALDNWDFVYVPEGGTVTENWHVADSTGAPIANQSVSLILAIPYSGSSANWTSNVNGTTDAHGNVSFAITNTDTATLACPSDMSSAAKNGNEGGASFTRTALQVNNAADKINAPATQATDQVDLIAVGC